MAYTVRATAEDEETIDSVKLLLNEKSATKAMIKSCELLPMYAKKIEKLEKKSEKFERKYYELVKAIQDKEKAQAILDNVKDVYADFYDFEK